MTELLSADAVPARPRRARMSDRTARVAIAATIGAILAVIVLPPLYFLVHGSFEVLEGREIHIGLGNYARLVSDADFLHTAANSLVFALGSAVLALLFGGIVAWLVERTNAPFKSLAFLTTVVSLGTPYVLYVSAWLLMLNRSGPLNSWWRSVTGGPGVLIDVYSMGGMILVEGLLWSPLVFLLLGATLRNNNPDYEDAARMSGAGVWQTFRRITFRLSLPAVLALAMLVFIRAVEAFEVPALVGLPGKTFVLTTSVYESMHAQMPPDLGGASALSVILLGAVGVLLYFYGRMTRNAERFATITGKAFKANKLDLGRWRWLGGAVLILNFVLLLVLPMAMLLWASLLPFYRTFSVAALKLLSFKNYEVVLGSTHYLGLMANTLIVAFAAATLVMVMTALIAWLSVRKSPGHKILDQLAMAPIVFPGIVLSLGMMQFFLQLPFTLYGTIWILIVAFVVNFLPYGARYAHAGMLQIHRELEEAAAMSGASTLVSLRRIALPLLLPSLVAGWLFIFLMGARVLSLPILLSGPRSQTMAVAMFDLWGNGQGTELAALGLLWSAMMVVIAGVFHITIKRTGTGIHGRS